LYKLAAEQGNPNAQAKLGLCYEEGRGVANDIKEAFKWYKYQWIQLSDLTMGDAIGSGAFQKGKWKQIPVALKILQANASENDRESFLREAKLMNSLQNPHVVPLLGVCKSPYILVMPLYPISLSKLLLRSEIKLEWPWRWRIAYEIAMGLNGLNGSAIFHRDIKSANILIDDESHAFIADFGLSKFVASKTTSAGGPKGTLQWMAPELLSGRDFDEKCEVFSYGVLLWELATRTEPYRINGIGSSEEFIMEFVKEGNRLVIPADACGSKNGEEKLAIPKDFIGLIEKCWHQDPLQRPSFKNIVDRIDHIAPFTKETVFNIFRLQQDISNETKSIGKWTVDDVCRWLAGVNFGEYGAQFTQHKIDGPSLLLLDQSDLEECFGGMSRIQRKNLLSKILELKSKF